MHIAVRQMSRNTFFISTLVDLSWRNHEQCGRYPTIKDLNNFELLRYGSYKSFMTQSRKSDKKF